MNVQHPITDDLLMGYATGGLPAAQDLIVATAVSLDDEARARLAGFDALGGALLEDAEPMPVADGALNNVLERLAASAPEDSVHADIKTARRDWVLPRPLRDAVGGDLDAVRWKSVGMGVKQCVIDSSPDGTVRLLSIPAGQAMPDHGHGGSEITLVLQGAYLDGDLRFARGDVEVASEGDEHMPVADLGEDCICLVVTDAPLRFTGLVPRIAQKFLRI
ncbi:ChrR family anti-sigma-E factor [Jannaschia pohangensis]|nr:ChrR family anti-sigma-E factor [Jannaschia pohangensis]